MIYLDAVLAESLAQQRPDPQTGCLEWRRYTGNPKDDGTVVVWAWVNNVARKIGIMTRDGKHGLTATPDVLIGTCLCGNWQSPSVGSADDDPLVLDEWKKHAKPVRP